MANYTQKIVSAQRIIKAKGAAIIWRKLPRTADTNQPWKKAAAPTQQDFPGTFVVFVNQGLNNALINLIKNTDVTDPSGPDAIMAGGQIFIPEITDIIVAKDGTKFIIGEIGVVAPDGTPIIYLLRFK